MTKEEYLLLQRRINGAASLKELDKNKGLVPVGSLAKKKVDKFSLLKDVERTVVSDNTELFDDLALYESGYDMRREIALDQMRDYLNYEADKKAIKINIKPLTVNRAWRGQRFKTPEYKKYHEAVTLLLPNDLAVPDGLLRVSYEFGMSKNSDVDNPVKPIQDILQAKYNFNDNRIMELHIKKVFVPKGREYISFCLEAL